MLTLTCPWCGRRDRVEFRHGGDPAHALPPTAAEGGAVAVGEDADLTRYLYLHDNRRGVRTELWWHWAGCRQWFLATRDVARDELQSTEPMSRP